MLKVPPKKTHLLIVNAPARCTIVRPLNRQTLNGCHIIEWRTMVS